MNHVRMVLDSFRDRYDWKEGRRTALTAPTKYLVRTTLHLRSQLLWLAFLRAHPLYSGILACWSVIITRTSGMGSMSPAGYPSF